MQLDRRGLLKVMGGTAAVSALAPGWARSATPGLATLPTLSGEQIALSIGHAPIKVDGRSGHAVAINGTVPGPLLRLKEGQRVRIAVTNTLEEDTSLHWHGLLVPDVMDGVPGLSFPGVKPGETFVYDFPVRQAGTYWYHSHSGVQEMMGVYAPIVIDPAGADPVAYDREHVIVLSDFSRMHPHKLMARLKQQPGYFNMQKQTVAGLLAGRDQPLKDRLAWGAMRMDPTDISDVTGSTYTYLINGHGPKDGWTALFQPGERVRLRFVNAAGMTLFNVRIPGLGLTVVQADGENVIPVEVDEFQIAPGETYDIVVRPAEDRAYALVAEAIDRSGRGLATLAPRPGMTAEPPPLRRRPVLTMKDMGMDMGGMDMSAMAGMAGMEHAGHDMSGHDMSGHSMDMRDPKNAPQVKMGPGVQMIAPMPQDRTGDPGVGLEDVGHRTLSYKALVALEPNPDRREPSRAVEIHLTGNMERFMWSFDGEIFGPDRKPIAFERDERVRVTLVNDSMMPHPIHLHGHYVEVVTGAAGRHPRKHTVVVQPGGKLSFDLTADAPGDWAFHCHMLLHMHAGMFAVVKIRPLDEASA